MPKYQYVNTSGALATIEANTPELALSSARDKATDSGVALISNAPNALGSSSIGNPVNAPATGAATNPGPVLPTPQAPVQNDNFVSTLGADLKNTRTALESSYKTNIDSLNTKIADASGKIDNFNALESTGVLNNVNDLTQPFRDTLETTQREALYVNENFQANQKLVDELDSLLNEGNQLIKNQKEAGGLASIAIPNLNKTISDVNARAGVIQAVIAARNNQISVAERLIDRTATAINADRKDRLDYYDTLYKFYEDAKDEEGNKLIDLSNEKKTFLGAQITLLQNDLKNSQETVDYIKKLSTDPSTALSIAQAGVTLNDTVPEINKKLADYAYTKAKNDLINSFAEKGYQLVSTAEIATHPRSELYVTKDAKGNDLIFWKNPAKVKSGSTPVSGDQKTINAFKKDLTNISQVKSAGSREQFIRILESRYPDIDPSSIEEYVYGTYPDGYDSSF